jgi:hypothetical protein
MFSFIRRLLSNRKKRKSAMERQKLTHITRGLQHAAAETNSLVSQQYIRVMSEYFDKLPDGSLKAKMVRVELDDEHYVMVPLVSLAAPTGLGLDRMRVGSGSRTHPAVPLAARPPG